MAGGVTALVLGDTLHPYPTVSEIVRWTADQIGKAHDAGDGSEVRHAPYTEARAEVQVHSGATSTGHAAIEEQVADATEHRVGYGEAEDCVANAGPAA